MGVALNLEYGVVKGLVFDDVKSVNTSEIVTRSGFVMQVGVGTQLMGRIVNPLAHPVDGLGHVDFTAF